MAHLPVLIRVLRQRRHFLAEVRSHAKLESKIMSLLTISSFCFAAYGATN